MAGLLNLPYAGRAQLRAYICSAERDIDGARVDEDRHCCTPALHLHSCDVARARLGASLENVMADSFCGTVGGQPTTFVLARRGAVSGDQAFVVVEAAGGKM